MEKRQAFNLAGLLEDWVNDSISSVFEIHKLDTLNERLINFHQWTRDKSVIAGFNVVKIGESSLYFLFIDWHRNGNYYLVVYAANKATTYAEIQHIVEHEGKIQLHWKYNPLKRDGKNQQRKAYFKQIFGSTSVYISLPAESAEVESFLQQIFRLSANRIKADKIVDVFSIDE